MCSSQLYECLVYVRFRILPHLFCMQSIPSPQCRSSKPSPIYFTCSSKHVLLLRAFSATPTVYFLPFAPPAANCGCCGMYKCFPRLTTSTVMPTAIQLSRSSSLPPVPLASGNSGQICMPIQPFPGAPSSTARCALSDLSGSSLSRAPVSGWTFGNVQLQGARG